MPVPVAETTIEPFVPAQLEGLVGVTELIESDDGAVKVVAEGAVCGHESSAFRTRAVYDPAAKLLKTLLVCQFVPSIEYSKGACPE